MQNLKLNKILKNISVQNFNLVMCNLANKNKLKHCKMNLIIKIKSIKAKSNNIRIKQTICSQRLKKFKFNYKNQNKNINNFKMFNQIRINSTEQIQMKNW